LARIGQTADEEKTMRLFGFVVLAVGGIVLLYLCASPFWMAAVAALGLLGAGWILGVGIWPPLGRFELQLRSPDRAVQLRALAKLETMLETEYEHPLGYLRAMLERAGQDEDAEVRAEAARLLKRLEVSEPLPEHPYEPVGGPQIVEAKPPLDPETMVAEILETHSGKAAIAPLIGVLHSDDPEACRRAVDALVEIGDPAIPALELAQQDANPDVRVDVERALHLIHGEPPLET
jgi:HEAT repeat protein